MEKLPVSRMIEEFTKAQDLSLLKYIVIPPSSNDMPSSVWVHFPQHITPTTKDILIQFIRQKYSVLYINSTIDKNLIYIHYQHATDAE